MPSGLSVPCLRLEQDLRAKKLAGFVGFKFESTLFDVLYLVLKCLVTYMFYVIAGQFYFVLKSKVELSEPPVTMALFF